MTDFQTKAWELMQSHDDNVYRHSGFAEALAAALSAAYEQGKLDEREACARIAETDSCGEAEEEYGDGYSDACFHIASAIRTRGEA